MKKKSSKSKKQNPCRVIRVKRRMGHGKNARILYARRKFCFNPEMSFGPIVRYTLHPGGDRFTIVLSNEHSKEKLRKIIHIDDSIKIQKLLSIFKLKYFDDLIYNQGEPFHISPVNWMLIKGWI